LNSIIEAFNRRFGDIDWGDGIDKIEVEEILTQQIPLKIGQNKEGLQYIINSDKSNAREESNNLVKSMMQGMMFTNTAIYKKFVDDDNFRRRYEEFIFDIVWSSQQGGRGEVR
jgi:type I restriction enzyme R subunit